MLARFFKPNWQHVKPAKRIKAIAQLNENLADDQAIIFRLATQDLDASVRLSAIEKLNNLNQLITISVKDPAEQNKQQALHSISKILLKSSSISIEDKCSALNSIRNHDLLIHLVLNSNEEKLRLQALEQLDGNTHLATIIRESQRAAVRVAATERLNCQETLEAINKEARNKDKGVFRASRDKLSLIREQQKQQLETEEKIEKTLCSLQQLSRQEDPLLYAAKLSAIQQEWSDLTNNASSIQQTQFLKDEKTCLAFISEQHELENKKAAAIELQNKHKQLKAELLIRFDELHQQLKTPCTQADELSIQEKQVEQLLAQWNEVNTGQNALAPIESQLKFIKQSTSAQHRYFSLDNTLAELSNTLNEQLSSSGAPCEALPTAQNLIKKLQWPQSLDKPEQFIRLASLIEKALSRQQKSTQKNKEKQQELGAQLNILATAIQQGEIKSADKQLKKVEQLSKQFQGNLPNHIEQRFKQLTAELQEIRSWQSYAVTPKKEALCAAMEELIDSKIELQERSNQIKKIQKEWKLLDATDSEHSQTLWKRFKKASDKAYAPCDQYFSEQRQLRIENLKQRENICQQLTEAIQHSQTENPNWKQIEEGIRTAKQAWRTHTPVDRAPGKKIQQVFERLIAQLEEPLKQYRADNGKEKLRIVERTEVLLQSHDQVIAAQEVKQLQQQWKELGPASRNQERKLWGRFRENCSLVFERFHALDKQEIVQGDNISSQLEQLCSKLEAFQQSPSNLDTMEQAVTTVKSELVRLQQEHTHLSNKHLQRIEQACSFVEQQKTELFQLLTEPYEAFQRKAVICEQLELAILENCASDKLASLQEAWQQGPSLPEDLEQAINARFLLLVDITQSPVLLEQTVPEQEALLRQLCIRIEIASSQPSPSEDQALRMEYQMQRIQQALDQQQQACSLADIKRLEYEWLCIPFAGHFEELHQRFGEQLKTFF